MFWVVLFSYPLHRWCIKMKCGWRRHKAFHWTRNLGPFFLRHVPSCFLTNYNSNVNICGSRKIFRGVGGSPGYTSMFGKFIMKLKEIGRPPPFNPSRSTHDQRKVFFLTPLLNFSDTYQHLCLEGTQNCTFMMEAMALHCLLQIQIKDKLWRHLLIS